MVGNNREILILDDDRVFCEALKDHLQMRGYSVSIALSIRDASRILRERKINVAFIDQKLPDGDGLSFSEDLIRAGVDTKNVLITAFAGVSAAVKAIRAGVFDYLQKPVSLELLERTLERALYTSEYENTKDVPHTSTLHEESPDTFVGSSKSAISVRMQIRAIADAYPSPVLITGETGTGKGLVARIIHSQSSVSNRELITVNCAAIPETMFEAELFGHEKGAFTGAYKSTKGLFELADGSTLLLDEIGELPLFMQAKLLRVLEEGLVRRVGGHTERRIRIRVMASTNRDLKSMVAHNQFRVDLYYRLAVLHIDIPPLRERKQDVPELIEYLCKNDKDRNVDHISEDHLRRIQQYDWPGNVRELRNFIERGLMLREKNFSVPLDSGFLSSLSSNETTSDLRSYASLPTDILYTHQPVLTLAELEDRYIEFVLSRVKGNRTTAAKLLGLSRSTLRRWLRNQSQSSLGEENGTLQ